MCARLKNPITGPLSLRIAVHAIVRTKYDVKNGAITLKGNVNSQARRASVEHMAAGVPNVRQVVNELEVKNQKASSTD